MSDWIVSMDLEFLLSAGLVAAIFGTALAFAIRSGRRQNKMEREFAESQGWTYTGRSDDPQGIVGDFQARIDRICPQKVFKVTVVRTVEAGERRISLFSCWYRERDWGHDESLGSACLIESARFRSVGAQVDISERNRLDAALHPHQIDMGDSEFSRAFIVVSKDPISARLAVNESLQRAFLQHCKDSPIVSEVSIGPGGAVVLKWGQAASEQWLELLEIARRMESTPE